MLVDIRHLNFSVSDALHEFTHRRVTRALWPFQEAVSRVDVRTRDVNGPRGGIDIECSVTVALNSIEQPVVITSKGADAYAAIQSACTRLHEAVSRTLGRRRRIERSAAPPSRTAPRRTATASGPEKTATDAGTLDSASDIVVTAMDHERLQRLIQASQDTRDRDAAEFSSG